MIRNLLLILAGLGVLGGVVPPAHAQLVYSAAAAEIAEKLVAAFPEITGQVLAILPDERVVLDLTRKAGAYAGLEIEVFRAGDEFRHPLTREILGRVQIPVGTLRVDAVEEKFSIAALVGAVEPQRVRPGDGVRVTGARLLLGLAGASSSGASEGETRAATRDLEVTLARTKRFEVVDERRMRAALVKANLAADLPLTDPAALEVLRRELRLTVVALPRISPLGDRTLLDVEAVSTLSGKAITLASVEVPGSERTEAVLPPAPPAPARVVPVPGPEERPAPAWIGPRAAPGSGTKLSPTITVNPDFGARAEVAAQPYAVQFLPAGVMAMDFGDLDGDGRDEMVAITKNEVLVFDRTGNLFALRGRLPGPSTAEYLTVNVADVNRNGRAEIFVTNLTSRLTSLALFNQLHSFVLERQGDRYAPVWENVPLFLRVLKTPGYPDGLLLAQRMGMHEPYEGPVTRYRWNGERYVPDPAFRLPQEVAIHGFALVDLDGDSREEIVRLGPDGILRVETRAGKGMVRSAECFGLFDHLSFSQPLQDRSEQLSKDFKPERTLKRRYLGRPVIATPLGPAGRPGILVGMNRPSGGIRQYFENIEQGVEGGQVVHLAWDRGTIKRQWETPFTERSYVADYGLVRLDEGLGVAVLSLEQGLFRKAEAMLEIHRVAAGQ